MESPLPQCIAQQKLAGTTAKVASAGTTGHKATQSEIYSLSLKIWLEICVFGMWVRHRRAFCKSPGTRRRLISASDPCRLETADIYHTAPWRRMKIRYSFAKITSIFSTAVVSKVCAHYVVKPSANDHRNAFLCSIMQLFLVKPPWPGADPGPADWMGLMRCEVCNLSEVYGLWSAGSAGLRRGLSHSAGISESIFLKSAANYPEDGC